LGDHPLYSSLLFGAVSFELSHVQVAPARDPLLRLLHRQRRNQAQARSLVGKDPHHPAATLYLLVEPLEPVRGADAPAVRLGESQAAEALLYVLFEMLGYLLVALLLAPFLGDRSGDGEGLFSVGSGEDCP